jgi:hypothetical protein
LTSIPGIEWQYTNRAAQGNPSVIVMLTKEGIRPQAVEATLMKVRAFFLRGGRLLHSSMRGVDQKYKGGKFDIVIKNGCRK